MKRARLHVMKMRRFRFQISTLLIILTIVAVGLGWYVKNVLNTPDYKIMHVGGSLAMAPTITREYLAVDLHAYRTTKPARWDVVALEPELEPTGAYIAKVLRVIGLPGETVSLSDGKIVVNGQPVTPPQNLQEVNFSSDVANVKTLPPPYTVPEGHYFLLGDNPAEANDSRIRGAYPEAEIRGRVSGSR